MVHWCGAQYHDLTAEHADLHTDLADLEAKENQLDDLIRNAELQLQLLNEDKTNAYVTYQVKLLVATSSRTYVIQNGIKMNDDSIASILFHIRIFEIFQDLKTKRSLL